MNLQFNYLFYREIPLSSFGEFKQRKFTIFITKREKVKVYTAIQFRNNYEKLILLYDKIFKIVYPRKYLG